MLRARSSGSFSNVKTIRVTPPQSPAHSVTEQKHKSDGTPLDGLDSPAVGRRYKQVSPLPRDVFLSETHVKAKTRGSQGSYSNFALPDEDHHEEHHEDCEEL